MNTSIIIETHVPAPLELAWTLWTEPVHIMQWNSASPDWHTPHSENDLRPGGSFSARMEARDGSMGFDFGGTYTDVVPQERIAYTLGDGRTVDIRFAREGSSTRIRETFDAETENPPEMQQAGWQAILDSFSQYAGAQAHGG